jgi:hypothetical protein
MGFAGGASKKRKRTGDSTSPTKKGPMSGGNNRPSGLLPVKGASRLGIMWEELLRLPGETTQEKCRDLLDNVYNPLRQQVYEELRLRKLAGLPLDSHMWEILNVVGKEDPRLAWCHSPGNMPPGMRKHNDEQVDPDDYATWDWLREVVPGMHGFDNTTAVADATDPLLVKNLRDTYLVY